MSVRWHLARWAPISYWIPNLKVCSRGLSILPVEWIKSRKRNFYILLNTRKTDPKMRFHVGVERVGVAFVSIPLSRLHRGYVRSQTPIILVNSSTGSRLSCGYCKNKLGSLSLEGIVSCPCSTDLPRGIIVNPSRVDKFKVLRWYWYGLSSTYTEYTDTVWNDF